MRGAAGDPNPDMKSSEGWRAVIGSCGSGTDMTCMRRAMSSTERAIQPTWSNDQLTGITP